jgi:hypothetical protein
LVWCFLLDGKKPHGIAPFTYTHPTKRARFNGVGVFNNGVLEGGPAVYVTGVKKVLSFANMTAGVPSGWGVQYLAEDTTMYTNSLKTKNDVTGMIYYVGKWSGSSYQGLGKMWSLFDGSIFVGDWHNDLRKEGCLYELQEDGTFKLFNVFYNAEKDEKDEV